MDVLMKILIACEMSGVVRMAFTSLGHEAVSCDLLPTEMPGPHYQGDVFDIIADKWDMMIAFPPCTHLAVSGARYFAKKTGGWQTARRHIIFYALGDVSRNTKGLH
jgi:hypothetical protein